MLTHVAAGIPACRKAGLPSPADKNSRPIRRLEMLPDADNCACFFRAAVCRPLCQAGMPMAVPIKIGTIRTVAHQVGRAVPCPPQVLVGRPDWHDRRARSDAPHLSHGLFLCGAKVIVICHNTVQLRNSGLNVGQTYTFSLFA